MPSMRENFQRDVKRIAMNTDDFAVEAYYTPRGSTTQKKINVIYKESFKEAAPFRVSVANGETVAIASTLDVTDPQTGDELVINSETKYVIRSDGNSLAGKTILIVSEANPIND